VHVAGRIVVLAEANVEHNRQLKTPL
jgi:hypothetical protein